MSAILVDGREVACDATVRADKHLQFTALGRRTTTSAVVWHWTGGQGLGPQVFRTLQERRLSVHFNIDPNGDVWQFADASLRCSHAGIANGWSIGVEMTNPATPAAVDSKPQRMLVNDVIHGKPARYSGFTVSQTTAARALADALERAYGLPREIPLSAALLPPAVLQTFRGHIGHLHVSEQKRDPGYAFLLGLVRKD